MNNCRVCQTWYLDLMNDISLSATNEINTSFKGVEFKVFRQEVTKTKISRNIGFFVDNNLICSATNDMKLNDFTKHWVLNRSKVPLGTYLSYLNHEKVFLKKGISHRVYDFKGDIDARISEYFYRFCPQICDRFSPEKSYRKSSLKEILNN